jgi:hypothetical protein
MTNPDDPQNPPEEAPFEDALVEPEEPAAIAAEAEGPGEAPVAADDAITAEMPVPPVAVAMTGRVPAAAPARPDLLNRQEPLYHDCQGYRLRMEPADLARLRELPGSRGLSDEEIGGNFFTAQAERIAASVAGDVPPGAELRVVVDPYSRQAFVALENRIRGILSF